jgi:hypothetical protein
VTQKVKEGKYNDICKVDSELRELAAEDVIDTLTIGVATSDFSATGGRFLSYEGPFGVGYLIAILHCE